MIISHQHKFIFVKPFKVAGTSVEISLINTCGESDIITVGPNDIKLYGISPRNMGKYYNHMIPRKIINLLGREIWDSYLKFTVVRNPWDAMVSYYWWRKKYIGDFPKAVAHSYLDNERYYFDKNGKAIMDFYIRYEQLQDDFNELCDKLGISRIELPVTRGMTRKSEQHYSTYYSEATKEIVASRNQDTIDYFNYEFEGDLLNSNDFNFIDKSLLSVTEPLKRRYYRLNRI